MEFYIIFKKKNRISDVEYFNSLRVHLTKM